MLELKPPEELYRRILEEVRQQTLLRLRRRVILFSSALLASVAGFVAASTHLYAQISDSGFLQMLSLAGSDFRLISSDLSDYLLSLIESFPIMSVALFCAVLGATAFFLFKLARSASELKDLGAR